MIDYIKFTLDGKDYYLIQNPDGSWSKNIDAPDIAGRYDLILEVVKNGFHIIIDSSDPRYIFYLTVIQDADSIAQIQEYVPKFMGEIMELKVIYEAENYELDKIYLNLMDLENNNFIRTASTEIVTNFENFLGVKGAGTLTQRKDYLIALMQKGKKLSERSIQEITNIITGSVAQVTFYSGDQFGNPYPTNGFLRIQVLSPDGDKDYRYEDILRTLKPMIPAHIKIIVEKYFALWQDINDNFLNWSAVRAKTDWRAIRNYIPPQ